jgi:hypothetical protein
MEQLQAQFVQVLQEQCGLSADQANSVAPVALKFAMDHKEELMQLAASSEGGGIGGALGGILGGH